MERATIVCLLANISPPHVESTRTRCDECRRDVWIAPSSMEQILDDFGVVYYNVVCNECTLKGVQSSPEESHTFAAVRGNTTSPLRTPVQVDKDLAVEALRKANEVYNESLHPETSTTPESDQTGRSD